MRISTAYPQTFNANSMFDLQNKVNETQLKISSGKKYLSPSENPSAAAYAIGFKQSIEEANKYQDNIGSVNDRLKLEETALSSVIDTIQRLQELGLQGMNESGNSQSAREAIAREFDQLNDHLVGLANTRSPNGEYIFSGTKTNIMPFSKADINAQALSTPPSIALSQSQNVKATEPAALAWKNYVENKAAQDVYSFLNNPDNSGKTLQEALSSFSAQNPQYIAVDQLGKLAAAQNHTVFPAAWNAAWDATPSQYEAAFAIVFNKAKSVNSSASGLVQASEINLSKARVATAAAYDSYSTTLNSYAESMFVTAEMSTPKSEAWTDYIQKQATADAYNFVSNYPLDKLKSFTEIRDVANLKNADIQKLGSDLEVAQRNAITKGVAIINDPTGINNGSQGTLALRKAAEQTDTLYKTTFETAYKQAMELRLQPNGLEANSDFNNGLASVSASSNAAWNTYSVASDKSVNVLGNNGATTNTSDATDVTQNIASPHSAFIYSGSAKYRDIQIGSGRTITDGDLGMKVFSLPSSADPINGKKLFDSVKNFAEQLRAGKPTLETLQEFDEALANVSTVRSSIGARQNVLDRQKQTNDDFIINTKTALSQIEDLDYAQAITELNAHQTSLQAAQQSYSKVQGMSLFKFL